MIGCSFCGKSRDKVTHLVAAKKHPYAHICDECIDVCRQILEDDFRETGPATKTHYKLRLSPDWLRDGLRCSFCGRPQHYVEKLISSPDPGSGARTYICGRCVALANKAIAGSGAVPRGPIMRWLDRLRHGPDTVFHHIR